VRSLQVALQAVPKHTTPAFKQASAKAAIQVHAAAFVLTLPVMGWLGYDFSVLAQKCSNFNCCDSKTC